MEINTRQTKQLRSLAHALKPVVRIGQKGLTDAVLAELEIALDHHELIKVKIAGDREERNQVIGRITEQTTAHKIALTGAVAVLFRRNPKSPVIDLKKNN